MPVYVCELNGFLLRVWHSLDLSMSQCNRLQFIIVVQQLNLVNHVLCFVNVFPLILSIWLA